MDYFSDPLAPSPTEYLEIVQDEESESKVNLQDWEQSCKEMESFIDTTSSPACSAPCVIKKEQTDVKVVTSDVLEDLSTETMDVENMPMYILGERNALHCLPEPATGVPMPLPIVPPKFSRELINKIRFDEQKEAVESKPRSRRRKSPLIPRCEPKSFNTNKVQRRVGKIVKEIYLNDDDVPPELLEKVQQYDASCSVNPARRQAKKRRVNENDENTDDEYLASEDFVAQQLFGSDSSALNFEWSPMSSFVSRQETFQPATQPGPRQPTACAYKAFRQYWDDEILNHIVTETNRYASEKNSTLYANEWYETNVHEILILFAFWMMLGIIQMPSITSCFTTHPLLQTNVFRTLFTQRRYWLLCRTLYFVNNATHTPDSSKLFYIGPILDHLNRKFSECYTLDQNIAIDESLILWTGKLSFKQFRKTKRTRLGINTFEICEASTGYLWSFLVYQGKDSSYSSTSFMPKAVEVVVRLTRPLLNKGYRVFMDNWFNSPLLARYLKRNGTDCVGTLSVKRKNVPTLMKLAPMPAGTCIARHCGDVAVMAYQAYKTFYTISTHHGTDSVPIKLKLDGTVSRRPKVINDYYKFMGGVHRKDQLLEPYLTERKWCHKWYRRLFKRLLNISILNSHILVGKSDSGQPAQLAFRLELVDKIMKKHLDHVPPKKKQNLSNVTMPQAPYPFMHFVERIGKNGDTSAGSSRSSQLRHCCVRCRIQDKRYRKTIYQCDTCRVPLCLIGCFKRYHTGT